MEAWQSGDTAENPYVRTAFRLARVARETTQHRKVVQAIGQTRKVVRAAAGVHVVGGVAVTEMELNEAEEALLSPRGRLREELRHHAAEPSGEETLRRVLQQVREAVRAASEQGMAERPDLTFLRPWVETLAQAMLKAAPTPSPWLGRAELQLQPPFGPEENEAYG